MNKSVNVLYLKLLQALLALMFIGINKPLLSLLT
jgi:hypothetical protein